MSEVFRLIYRSNSRIGDQDRRTELGEIFTVARRKNRDLVVTGALMLSGDAFVLALEGDEPVVRGLYATICGDPRHDGLSVIDERTVGERTFGRWAMARVAEDGRPDIRLLSNASAGVIVAAPGVDGSITAEQEEVLASMRASILLDASGT